LFESAFAELPGYAGSGEALTKPMLVAFLLKFGFGLVKKKIRSVDSLLG